MNWNILYKFRKKLWLAAMMGLFALPYIAILLNSMYLDISSFKVVISGSFLFLIFVVALYYLCPQKIKLFEEDQYTKHCVTDNVNPFGEFSFINNLEDKSIKELFKGKEHLYPINRGLEASRLETIRVCSAIEFSYLNEGNYVSRWVITIGFLVSAFLINYPGILRLIKVYSI